MHRLGAFGQAGADGTSELGYLLAQRELFAGATYYRTGRGFTRHAADFDFDFLPVPTTTIPRPQDARTAVAAAHPGDVRLVGEAVRLHGGARRPSPPARRAPSGICSRMRWKAAGGSRHLLARTGVEPAVGASRCVTSRARTSRRIRVTSVDLQDDRWGVRAWHADRWIGALECRFTVKDIAAARPDLWASDDPSAVVPGETADRQCQPRGIPDRRLPGERRAAALRGPAAPQ